jgi:hypothetical protein
LTTIVVENRKKILSHKLTPKHIKISQNELSINVHSLYSKFHKEKWKHSTIHILKNPFQPEEMEKYGTTKDHFSPEYKEADKKT